MRRYFFLLALLGLSCVLPGKAAIPDGYYVSLNGLSEAGLKTALHNIIGTHAQVSSYNALPDYFRYTDVRPSGNEWWEMYSDEEFVYPSFTGMNREHAVPKSWWGGSTSIPAYTDLFHLYPSEMDANQAKSNYPLGEVMTSTFDNGVSKVGYAANGMGGGASKVFEPDDEYKGDFARTYFYVATCYQNLSWKYTYMMQNNTYPTFNEWAIELLLKWHREDPVSQKEIDRNEVVYSYQHNRNPFIDMPALAEYVWGDKRGEPFYVEGSTSSVLPVLSSPVDGMALDFGEVAIGQRKKLNLLFKGDNLSGTLALSVDGDDKEAFSLSVESLESSQVTTNEGYNVSVKYEPAALGAHEARLGVAYNDTATMSEVVLRGSCLEVPSLSPVKAFQATSVTATSYEAHWEASPEKVDYYIVTRTRFSNSGGLASVEAIEADGTSIEITDFDKSYRECYTVQSVRLDYWSPESNVVYVEHTGIAGVEADRPLAAICYPGWVRIICVSSHTNAIVSDLSGRVVMHLPVLENNMEIKLPYGIYMLTTDQQRYKPVRIIVR